MWFHLSTKISKFFIYWRDESEMWLAVLLQWCRWKQIRSYLPHLHQVPSSLSCQRWMSHLATSLTLVLLFDILARTPVYDASGMNWALISRIVCFLIYAHHVSTVGGLFYLPYLLYLPCLSTNWTTHLWTCNLMQGGSKTICLQQLCLVVCQIVGVVLIWITTTWWVKTH